MNISEQIQSELDSIEKEQDVTVFYCCESGSRAWGFESGDSDYDVRFLYYHCPSWYLSVQDHRDVIEKPITDELDVSGWDVKKALQLMRRSNPPLLEWLRSPIIYRNISEKTDLFRSLVPECYAPRNCYYHYYNMAKGNCREYLKGDTVWVKKYFYVLRPILGCRWIETHNEPVPMEFSRLLEATVKDRELTSAVGKLLKQKKAGAELDKGPAIPVISDFIESEMERLEDLVPDKVSEPDAETLDRVFWKIIEFKG